MPRPIAIKPVIVPETEIYKVLVSFTHKHVVEPVGSFLELTEAEAKYHLLAERIAIAVPEVKVEPKAEAKKDGK